MAEADRVARIRQCIRLRGGWSCKYRSLGEKGVPDILACYKGVFLGIEVKEPGKQPTGIQTAQGILIRQAGGIWFIATDEDTVSWVLDRIDQGDTSCLDLPTSSPRLQSRRRKIF